MLDTSEFRNRTGPKDRCIRWRMEHRQWIWTQFGFRHQSPNLAMARWPAAVSWSRPISSSGGRGGRAGTAPIAPISLKHCLAECDCRPGRWAWPPGDGRQVPRQRRADRTRNLTTGIWIGFGDGTLRSDDDRRLQCSPQPFLVYSPVGKHCAPGWRIVSASNRIQDPGRVLAPVPVPTCHCLADRTFSSLTMSRQSPDGQWIVGSGIAPLQDKPVPCEAGSPAEGRTTDGGNRGVEDGTVIAPLRWPVRARGGFWSPGAALNPQVPRMEETGIPRIRVRPWLSTQRSPHRRYFSSTVSSDGAIHPRKGSVMKGRCLPISVEKQQVLRLLIQIK